MGSYITIGFVYAKCNLERLENEFKNLSNYLIKKINKVKSIKACKDTDGEEWIEYNQFKNQQIGDLCDILTKNYYGQIVFESNILGIGDLEVSIRIEKEEDYFGYLLDISEIKLLKTRGIEELNSITERIITFIITLNKIIEFDYAFCDSEAEIQYSPSEVNDLRNNVHSIVVIPAFVEKEKKHEVIKSSWHIDGLTNRY